MSYAGRGVVTCVNPMAPRPFRGGGEARAGRREVALALAVEGIRCRGGQSVPPRVRGVDVVRDVPGAPRPFDGEREARAGGGEAFLGLASGGFRCPGGTSVPPLVRGALLPRRVVRGSVRALGSGAGRGAAARGRPGLSVFVLVDGELLI